MSLLPCLLPAADRVMGAPPGRFGDPMVDAYLEFLVARVRPNSVLAAWFDLKVFFAVVGKPVLAHIQRRVELLHQDLAGMGASSRSGGCDHRLM